VGWARIASTYFHHPKIVELDGRIITADLLAILGESRGGGSGHLATTKITSISVAVDLPAEVITEALVAAGRWEVDRDGAVVIHDFAAWQAREARIVEFVRVPTQWYQRRLPLDVATWALAIACLRRIMFGDDPGIKIETVFARYPNILRGQTRAAILTLVENEIWGWDPSDPLYLEVPEPIATPSHRCDEKTLRALRNEVARVRNRIKRNRHYQRSRGGGLVTGVLPASDRLVTGVLPASDRLVTGVLPASDRLVTGVLPASDRLVTDVSPAKLGPAAGQGVRGRENPDASLARVRAPARASARAREEQKKKRREEQEKKKRVSPIARYASDGLARTLTTRERASAREALSSESCSVVCVDADCPLVIWLATRRQMTESSPSVEKIMGGVVDARVDSSLSHSDSLRDRVRESDHDREGKIQDQRELFTDVTRDSAGTPPRTPPDLAGPRPLERSARGNAPAKLGLGPGEQPTEAPDGRALGTDGAVGGTPTNAGSGALIALEGAEPPGPVSCTTPPPPTPARPTQAALAGIDGAEVCPVEAAVAPWLAQIGSNDADNAGGEPDVRDDIDDSPGANLGLSAERVKFIQDVISGAVEVESTEACEVYSGDSLAALLELEENGAGKAIEQGAGGGGSGAASHGRARRGSSAASNAEADAAFEQWWKIYPRKVAKSRARGIFRKRFADGLLEEITVATKNYALARRGEPMSFTLHASTFLGPDERWKDWLPGSQQWSEWRQDPKNAGICMQRPVEDALARHYQRLTEYVGKLASAPFVSLDALAAEVGELASRAIAIEAKRVEDELILRSLPQENGDLPGGDFLVLPPGERFAAPEEWLTALMRKFAREGRYVVRFSPEEIETVRAGEMAAVEVIEAKRREVGLRSLTDPSVLEEFSQYMYRMSEMMCPRCRPSELQQMVQHGLDPQCAGLFVGEDFPRRYDRFVRELVPERIISSVLPEAQRAILAGVERWRADYGKVRDARLAGKVWVSARRGVERAVAAL